MTDTAQIILTGK